MNRLFTLFAFLVASFSTSAQVDVTLKMAQKLGDQPFSLNTIVTSDMGYAYNVTRLQYYVSEIKLIHDGGQVSPVADMYLLVNPSTDSSFDLGSFPISNLEQIQFSVGVDQAHNHLDPASYDNTHPLAPQNPSMHWGWASGYRFIALEGLAGADANSMNNIYQIHTVDDANYYTVYLDLSGETLGDQLYVNINADYTQLLNALDVSSGLISHASTGPSRTIVNNLRDVFSAGFSTSIIAPDVVGSFNSFPNPAKESFQINYDFPGLNDLQVSISDLSGKEVYSSRLDHLAKSKTITSSWHSGLYIIQLFTSEQILAIDKIIIE
jgi:hypothetical protein